MGQKYLPLSKITLNAYHYINGVAQFPSKVALKINGIIYILQLSLRSNIQLFNRFRTVTGACNNRMNPKWGKANTPYGRFQSALYSDGIHEIRKSVIRGEDLPAPRLTMNAITRNTFSCVPKFKANHGSVMYGQLMAHDHGMRQMMQTRNITFNMRNKQIKSLIDLQWKAVLQDHVAIATTQSR